MTIFASCVALDSEDQTDSSSRKLRRNLVGSIQKLPQQEKQWYSDSVQYFIQKRNFVFEPKDDTRLGAQPFCAWRVMLDMNKKWRRLRKRKIYLLQLGEMPDFINEFRDEDNETFWQFLAKFLENYFPGIEVEVMNPALDFFERNVITTREHSLTEKKQYLVTDIKEQLPLPTDAHCLLALSWTDLYPSEDLNFVLGEAYFETNVAVFCFGRFEPKLVAKMGECKDIQGLDGDIIYRLLRIISHETCHLFGLIHCVYFDCSMNASNSLQLALSQPLLCCPFCIRKIQYILDFKLEEYFANLIQICSQIHEQYPSSYWPRAVENAREFLRLLRLGTVNSL